MMKELLEQQVFMYVMLGLCIAGGLVKLILSVIYGGLVKASFHMPDTKNRLFKLMRLKFEACYKLKIAVHNAEGFVDKYMINHRFCGLCLHTWRKFSSQMTFLCLCLGISGAILGIICECSRNLVLEHLGMGLLTGAFLYLVDGLCAFDFKTAQMKINAVDYFDNFLRARLENEYFRPEEMAEYQQEYFEKDVKEQTAVSESRQEEYEEVQPPVEKAARPEPVPAKRRRKPEMFHSVEETAAARENVKTLHPQKKEKNTADHEMLERSMEELEKEKIIADILKEYLV